MARDLTLSFLAVALVGLLALGAVLPLWVVFLLTVAFAKALVVIGLVVMMRAGLVSFGQGLYYGLGAYAAGLMANFLGVTDAIALVILGGAVSAVTGFALGFVMARYREIFFAMLSLALSMILYGILVRSSMLGSTDGFNLPSPTYFGLAAEGVAGRQVLYGLTVIVTIGVAMVLTASCVPPPESLARRSSPMRSASSISGRRSRVCCTSPTCLERLPPDSAAHWSGLRPVISIRTLPIGRHPASSCSSRYCRAPAMSRRRFSAWCSRPFGPSHFNICLTPGRWWSALRC
jgi:hypothetical protein